MIVGHAHPAVVAAVREAMGRGSSFGAPTQGESDLAARRQARLPEIEMVRFVSSGTEASMSAIRLARAHTGREKVLKFAGCYHGHVDALLAEAGSGLATLGIPASPGVPAAVTAGTIVVPTTTTTRSTARSLSTAPTWPARSSRACPATWASCRRRAGSSNVCGSAAATPAPASMVDDVMSGFRVAPGGAASCTASTPT